MKIKPIAKPCNWCEIPPKLIKYSNLFRYECTKCFVHTPPFKNKTRARGYWNKFSKVLKTT